MPTVSDEEDVEGWNWDPSRCPCDEQFIDWMSQVGTGPRIFHMGTGLHHRVGAYCHARGLKCFGITVSREEYREAPLYYEGDYQVLFGNIWTLDLSMLPQFSVMSLFHLGEMEWRFGAVDIVRLKEILKHVEEGGIAVFYNRSAAFDRVKPVLEELFKQDVIKHIRTHRDLEVFRVV